MNIRSLGKEMIKEKMGSTNLKASAESFLMSTGVSPLAKFPALMKFSLSGFSLRKVFNLSASTLS